MAGVVKTCGFVTVVVAADTADAASRSRYVRFDCDVEWAVLKCPEELLNSCIGLWHIWHHMRKKSDQEGLVGSCLHSAAEAL